MAEYIEREALYKKLLELEALARVRVLDTPTTSPAYQRYSAQLTERNAIRHMIAEIPAADVAPVVHGHWVLEAEKGICMDFRVKAHCSECGHKWFGKNGVGNYSYVFSAFVRGPDEDAIAFALREASKIKIDRFCSACGAKMDKEDADGIEGT